MRRLLLISYYFPPSGGPGVQRALKFAKYLPAFGWQPTVLTVRPDDAAFPDLDPSLAADVPPGVRVERTGAWDPYALYARLLGKEKSETVGVGFTGEAEPDWKQRLARWVRANIFLPDARVGWVPFAVRRGRRLLREQPFDALLTTGPPHSAHLVGRWLAAARGVPWVADFRDPWTDIDFKDELPMTRLARRLDAALERSVLRRAAAVTVVTPTWKKDLARRVVGTGDGRFHVLRNGFDPADFAGPAPEADDRFTLAYLGTMSAARNPEALWRALAALDAPRTMPRLRVLLVGNADPVVLASARRQGVGALVETRPYVPHAEAVRLMRRSAALLLVINRAPNRMGIIPGKLYEYVASGRPVLSLGPSEGDAAAALATAGAGRTVGFGDARAVQDFLKTHYDAWAQGTPKAGAAPKDTAPFSRKQQAGTLAALLETLAPASSAQH